MKIKIKRELSLVLALCLCISMVPVITTQAETTGFTYNPDAAIAFAASHCATDAANHSATKGTAACDNGWLCAEFVAECLLAGGFPTKLSAVAGMGGFAGQITDYGEKITCSKTGAGYVNMSTFSKTLSKGDPIVLLYGYGTGSGNGHVVIYSGETESDGTLKVYGHNSRQQNEKLYSTSDTIEIFAVHIDSAPLYVDLGTDFTAPILNMAAWKPIENSYTESDKPPVRIQTENGKANQLWYFSRQSDGSYMISSCQDGKYLDVRDAGTGTGVVIQTCVDSGSNAQKWYLYEKDGGYIIESKLSGYVLDLVNNDSTSGNTLQTYENNGTTAQVWAIYRGDECKIKGPTLTVTASDSQSATKFSWTEVYGESRYDVKIWKGTAWDGDAYHIEWGATSGYSLRLPAGTYQAYVDAVNYYDCEMSNLVTFTVSEHQPINRPTGVVDYVTPGHHKVTVKGWAFDKDDVSRSVEIHVYIGGTYIGAGIANQGRPDVNEHYNYEVGDYHGYCFDCPIPLDLTGSQTVTVYAIDSEGTGNPELGSVTVEIAGHDYEAVVTDPTCTENGYTTYTCACGDSYIADEVTALGHSFTNYVSNNNATCTEDGTKTAKCDRCDATDTVVDEGSATGHLPTGVVDYVTPGLHKVTVKGWAFDKDDISRSVEIHVYIGDTYIGWGVANKERTDVNEHYDYGVGDYHGYHFDCSIPLDLTGSQTVTVYAIDSEGMENPKLGSVTVDIAGHDYEAVVTDPTCTEQGYTTYTCACGDSYTDHYVAALGHTPGEEVHENEQEDGSYDSVVYCSTCGDELSREYVVLPGVTVSGTVTSYGTDTDEVAVVLVDANGETVSSIEVTGNGTEYSFSGVSAGTYTLQISKVNHVTRSYTVVVEESDVTQDAKICLRGDVTGDGKVTATDYSRLLAHVKKTSVITDDYMLLCADVTGDGKITATDYSRLLAHVKKVSLLW